MLFSQRRCLVWLFKCRNQMQTGVKGFPSQPPTPIIPVNNHVMFPYTPDFMISRFSKNLCEFIINGIIPANYFFF